MRQSGLGCILLATALGAHAATLGRHSGQAVIGRPLDIGAQVLLAPGEDAQALCPRAEVYYGDTALPAGVVRTQIQKNAADAAASLRIQSSVAVNEPIVTLELRVGCDAPFSRRYVLLADFVDQSTRESVVGEQSPLRDGLAAAAPVAAEPVVVAPSEQLRARLGRPATAPSQRAAKPPTAAGASERARQTSPRISRSAEPGAGSRLQLDMLDLRLELDRDPVLKPSPQLLSRPAASEQERAAAARLWKAINATPQDILRDLQQLETLQTEVNGLREQAARDQAALTAAQADLQRARAWDWLVYALAAALLLVLAGVLWVWRQRRQEGRQPSAAWWAPQTAGPSATADVVSPDDHELDTPERSLGPAQTNPSSSTSAMPLSNADLDADLNGDLDLDLDLDDDGEPTPPRRVTVADFAPSQMGISRSMAAEELFDVQQKADFFMSLGDLDRAVQVLRQHLTESHEPSPLAYLDLLKLYHRLERRNDYERLRREFNRLLNADAPAFDQFSEGSRSLEDYTDALERIQALWLQPRVLDVIEKSIFRDPSDADGRVFDLEAYRELLLLHAIAKDLIGQESSAAAARAPAFESTDIRPLQAAFGGPSRRHAVVESSSGLSGHANATRDSVRTLSSLSLDIDLDELARMPTATDAESSLDLSSLATGTADDGSSHLLDFEVIDPDGTDDSAATSKR